MFFYLSFLRPPPLQVPPSGSISITPQVANDLRTELFSGSQEIYYAWSYISSHDRPNALQVITKPQKLTAWRQSSAYKEISVPLPPGIREGNLFRLVLSTNAQGNPHVINLASPALGERPFPVISMPILFSSLNRKGNPDFSMSGKQDQVERIYRIPVTAQDQVFMTVKEQTSFDLDKKIWDSGIGLSSWMVNLANDKSHSDGSSITAGMRDALFSSDAKSIIELGAGTGIVSLTLGALRSARTPSGVGCIITTDLPSAMPLLGHNISANESLFNSPSTRPRAAVLDWDEECIPGDIRPAEGGFHVIVMADVTYNTSSFPSLIRTLCSLIGLHSSSTARDTETVKQSPMILLGYKERDPAERSLWDMARESGIEFEKVGEKCGAGGEPVEIWIGIAQ